MIVDGLMTMAEREVRRGSRKVAKSEKEPVKRREIGCPQPGSVDDEKVRLQEEILRDEGFRAQEQGEELLDIS
jgi:hypothetical protein